MHKHSHIHIYIPRASNVLDMFMCRVQTSNQAATDGLCLGHDSWPVTTKCLGDQNLVLSYDNCSILGLLVESMRHSLAPKLSRLFLWHINY